MPEYDHPYQSSARIARTSLRSAYRERLIAKGCTERKATSVAWRRYP